MDAQVLAFGLGDETRRWELTRDPGRHSPRDGGEPPPPLAVARGTPFECVNTTLKWVHGEGKLADTLTTPLGCAAVAERLNRPVSTCCF